LGLKLGLPIPAKLFCGFGRSCRDRAPFRIGILTEDGIEHRARLVGQVISCRLARR